MGVNIRKWGSLGGGSNLEAGFHRAFTLADFSTMCICNIRVKNDPWFILCLMNLSVRLYFPLIFPTRYGNFSN